MYAVPNTQKEINIDEAIQWIEKAEKLGYYTGNIPRLLRRATEAIRDLLDENEPRTVQYVLDRLDKQFHGRLLNRADRLSADSAKTYIRRASRLLGDFSEWVKDPASFSPTGRRAGGAPEPKSSKGGAKGQAKSKKPANGEKSVDANDSAEKSPEHEASAQTGVSSPGTREHILTLSGGRAVIRLPATITANEARMLGMLIATHCPEARFDWPSSRPQREDSLAQSDS